MITPYTHHTQTITSFLKFQLVVGPMYLRLDDNNFMNMYLIDTLPYPSWYQVQYHIHLSTVSICIHPGTVSILERYQFLIQAIIIQVIIALIASIITGTDFYPNYCFSIPSCNGSPPFVILYTVCFPPVTFSTV